MNRLRDAFTIKDDWPQALVMSMGTLFLLCGLALEIVQYLSVHDGSKTVPSGTFVASHPGLILLGLGVAFILVGYFLPRTRAK